MRKSKRVYLLSFYLLVCLGLSVLSGCQLLGGSEDVTATLDVTQAYQTVNAKLTQSVAQTPSPSPQPSATITEATRVTAMPVTPTLTPTSAESTSPPVGNCNNLAAPGVPIDVTIPDDTQMTPGQVFTKTWRLQNAGTCIWTREYAVAYFSGEPMGAATSVKLNQDVQPGSVVDISVDMVAPEQNGSFQGNWKLRTGSGEWFGIGPNGDSPFWVRIQVVGELAGGLTPSPGAQSGTPTPSILASGSVNMEADDTLDLDTVRVNNAGGADLLFVNVAEGLHQLQTIGSARLGVFGTAQPSFEQCQSSTPGATFINVEALSAGTYICYRTGLGWPGRMMVSSYDPGEAALSLEITTWSSP